MPSDKDELWRMFFAVELPEEAKARFGEYLNHLRDSVPDVKASWERPEKVHITLKFIGNTERSRVDKLSLAGMRAVEGIKPFELTVAETGAFPPRGMPRVLWLGIKDESGGLARLHAQLEEQCSLVGFECEGRTFNPHLTVARLRTPAGAKRLAAIHRESSFNAVRFPVEELVVMRSELGPAGSRHTAISRHRLVQ